MARKHNFIIHKTKILTCGHEQRFSTPVPGAGEKVWCLTCHTMSSIPKRIHTDPRTIAEGRPRRLKKNPRSNNQYTKGRKLVKDVSRK